MKRLLILTAVFCAFVVGYGALALAYPTGGVAGRAENYGYFQNRRDTSTTAVFERLYQGDTESMPNTINSATEFINFIKYTKLDIDGNGYNTDSQDRTGAAVIIQTMIGTARNNPPDGGQIAEWEERVRYAEREGLITWRARFSYNINSGNQNRNGGPNDVAWWDESGTEDAMIFRNTSGQIVYVLKWRCANPVGNIRPLDRARNFTISGNTTITNSTNAPRGANPLPGDTIVFHHYLRNCNTPCTSTAPTNIWWVAQSMPSQTAVGGAANSGVYNVNQLKNVFNHTVPIPGSALPGTQFCERVGWDPVNAAGSRDGRGQTVCATVAYDFGLTPTVNPVVIHNGVAIPGDFAEPGDTIQFTYAVNNSGLTQSQSTTCTYREATWPGNNEAAPTTVFTPPGANCPPNRVFPRGNTNTVTENVPASAINTTVCRSLTVSPATHTGGTASDQACIKVAAKPYSRVWGGDVSAGNGLANSSGVCTNNPNAAIVGWNRNSPSNYAGAGTQFAAFALARITDYATALYDPGGAPQPNGLSFSNQPTNPSAGDFGGDFGGASCIPDYYGNRPASTLTLPANVSGMVTGIYGANGNVTLEGAGIINPGEKITVYINGDVMINTSITYAGNWNTGNVPSFMLIARGNIYVDNDVTQLDGTYIAQSNGGSGGIIRTCGTTGAGYAPLAMTSLYDTCTRKLTVNGSFIANQIQLLRTVGTLSQSAHDEASTDASIAETFNYGPATWIPQQPGDPSETPDYDAIISLPPVL